MSKERRKSKLFEALKVSLDKIMILKIDDDAVVKEFHQLKEFRKTVIHPDEVKKFLEYFVRVIELLNKYALKTSNANEVRDVFSTLLFIVDASRIYERIITRIIKLLDRILELAYHILIIKEFLRAYAQMLDHVPEPTLRKLNIKHKTHHILKGILINANDVELQAIILEVVFKLFKHNTANEGQDFREILEQVNLQDVNDSNVYQNIRMVLDQLNDNSKTIFSLNCNKIELDSVPIEEYKGATQAKHDIWLDVDLVQKNLSFFCHKEHVQIIEKVQIALPTTWEVLAFSANNVTEVTFDYDASTRMFKIFMFMQVSDLSLFAQSKENRRCKLDISVSKYSDKFDVFVKRVLPEIFPISFSAELLNFDHPQTDGLSNTSSPVIEHFEMPSRRKSYGSSNSIISIISSDDCELVDETSTYDNVNAVRTPDISTFMGTGLRGACNRNYSKHNKSVGSSVSFHESVFVKYCTKNSSSSSDRIFGIRKITELDEEASTKTCTKQKSLPKSVFAKHPTISSETSTDQTFETCKMSEFDEEASSVICKQQMISVSNSNKDSTEDESIKKLEEQKKLSTRKDNNNTKRINEIAEVITPEQEKEKQAKMSTHKTNEYRKRTNDNDEINTREECAQNEEQPTKISTCKDRNTEKHEIMNYQEDETRNSTLPIERRYSKISSSLTSSVVKIPKKTTGSSLQEPVLRSILRKTDYECYAMDLTCEENDFNANLDHSQKKVEEWLKKVDQTILEADLEETGPPLTYESVEPAPVPIPEVMSQISERSLGLRPEERIELLIPSSGKSQGSIRSLFEENARVNTPELLKILGSQSQQENESVANSHFTKSTQGDDAPVIASQETIIEEITTVNEIDQIDTHQQAKTLNTSLEIISKKSSESQRRRRKEITKSRGSERENRTKRAQQRSQDEIISPLSLGSEIQHTTRVQEKVQFDMVKGNDDQICNIVPAFDGPKEKLNQIASLNIEVNDKMAPLNNKNKTNEKLVTKTEMTNIEKEKQPIMNISLSSSEDYPISTLTNVIEKSQNKLMKTRVPTVKIPKNIEDVIAKHLSIDSNERAESIKEMPKKKMSSSDSEEDYSHIGKGKRKNNVIFDDDNDIQSAIELEKKEEIIDVNDYAQVKKRQEKVVTQRPKSHNYDSLQTHITSISSKQDDNGSVEKSQNSNEPQNLLCSNLETISKSFDDVKKNTKLREKSVVHNAILNNSGKQGYDSPVETRQDSNDSSPEVNVETILSSAKSRTKRKLYNPHDYSHLENISPEKCFESSSNDNQAILGSETPFGKIRSKSRKAKVTKKPLDHIKKPLNKRRSRVINNNILHPVITREDVLGGGVVNNSRSHTLPLGFPSYNDFKAPFETHKEQCRQQKFNLKKGEVLSDICSNMEPFNVGRYISSKRKSKSLGMASKRQKSIDFNNVHTLDNHVEIETPKIKIISNIVIKSAGMDCKRDELRELLRIANENYLRTIDYIKRIDGDFLSTDDINKVTKSLEDLESI